MKKYPIKENDMKRKVKTTKYFLFGLAFLGLVSSTSCSDLLNIDQHGVDTMERYYHTDEEVSAAVLQIYSEISSVSLDYYCLKNMLSDDFWAGGGGRGDNNAYEQLNEYTFGSEHSQIQSTFEGYYKIIYYSHVVMENVGEETAIEKNAQAQAKVFRAFAYIDLISMWGTPPLVDHLLSPSEYQVENGTTEALWALVENDLKEAIASGTLRQKSSTMDNSSYEITLQFAKALLGKAYLFQEKWAAAAEILDDLVSDNKYALFTGEYAEMLRPENKNNSESLFEINRLYDAQNPYNNYSMLAAMWGWRTDLMEYGSNTGDLYNGTWGFFNPQKNLYDAFVAREGVNGYRLSATMKSHSQIKEMGYDVKTGKAMYGHEGLFMWKNRTTSSEIIPGGFISTSNNTYFMRYAEVLLMAAEAHIRNGNTSKATQYVNEIRSRAKLSALASVTIDDVMTEKRLELWGESTRFQDMLRWGIAESRLKTQGAVIPSYPPSGITTWESYNGSNTDNYGFKSKHTRLPFPNTEMQVNKSIQQNPGW